MTDKEILEAVKAEIERLHEEHRGSKGDWYYRCMQDELVTIRNRLATNPEYQEYLKQHNKPIKEKPHEN